jgi:hypothetical protein
MRGNKRGGYLGGGTLVGPRTNWSWQEDRPTENSATGDHERSGPTAFEEAVQTYLKNCAEAKVKGLPRPRPPQAVTERYTGAVLRKWEKGILRTQLFKSAAKKAREVR